MRDDFSDGDDDDVPAARIELDETALKARAPQVAKQKVAGRPSVHKAPEIERRAVRKTRKPFFSGALTLLVVLVLLAAAVVTTLAVKPELVVRLAAEGLAFAKLGLFVDRAPLPFETDFRSRTESNDGRPAIDPRRVTWLVERDKVDTLAADLARLAERDETSGSEELEHALAAVSALSAPASALLDRWADKSPQAFAPFLVRGLYRKATAELLRSPALPKLVPARWFAARIFKLAAQDLERAIKLRAALPPAYQARAEIARLLGDEASFEEWLSAGRRACPRSLTLQLARLLAAAPRAGGSLEQMQAVADALEPAAASEPRLLEARALVAIEQAAFDARGTCSDMQRELFDQAVARSASARTLLARGECFHARADLAAAVLDLERAERLDPFDPAIELALARTLSGLGRFREAATSVLRAAQLAPATAGLEELAREVVAGGVAEGKRLALAGQHEAAAKIYELLLALAPERVELERELSAEREAAAPEGDRLDRAQSKIFADSNDYATRVLVTAALARARRSDKALPYWQQYLQRHPDDARAHYEKSRVELALARDAYKLSRARACELGVARACL